MADKSIQEEKFEAEIEALMNKLAELKAEISSLRKMGKDPVIADFELRSVKSKIMYYKVSRDKEDLAKIKKIFEEASKEIAAVKREKMIDVKTEVYEKAGIKVVNAEE